MLSWLSAPRTALIVADCGRLAPSYLIADGSELNLDLVRGARMIGLTAGASAPEILVHEVIEALRQLGSPDVTLLPGVEEDVEFRLPSELLDAWGCGCSLDAKFAHTWPAMRPD